FTFTGLPLITPFVPGVHARGSAQSCATSGAVMRTVHSSYDQPRPNGPQLSRCALLRPNAVSLSRVHSLARFMFGEPVRRGPTKSINSSAVSIAFELR